MEHRHQDEVADHQQDLLHDQADPKHHPAEGEKDGRAALGMGRVMDDQGQEAEHHDQEGLEAHGWELGAEEYYGRVWAVVSQWNPTGRMTTALLLDLVALEEWDGPVWTVVHHLDVGEDHHWDGREGRLMDVRVGHPMDEVVLMDGQAVPREWERKDRRRRRRIVTRRQEGI